MIYTLQIYILLALALAIFATQVFCLIDIAPRPAAAFPAEGKRTKKFWLILLVVAAVFGFLALPRPLGVDRIGPFLGMLSAVPAILYLVDVRPAILRHRRHPRGGGGPGRNTSGW